MLGRAYTGRFVDVPEFPQVVKAGFKKGERRLVNRGPIARYRNLRPRGSPWLRRPHSLRSFRYAPPPPLPALTSRSDEQGHCERLRREAIHRSSASWLDCFGASRLAKTTRRRALCGGGRQTARYPSRHCERLWREAIQCHASLPPLPPFFCPFKKKITKKLCFRIFCAIIYIYG